MSANVIPAQKSRFKIGWIILLVSAVLMALMHIGLIFILKEPVLFLGYTIFNLYAFLVILIPFRRGEKWAWAVTWLLPVGLVIPVILDPGISFYFGVAAVCGLGLLLTMQDFFAKRVS